MTRPRVSVVMPAYNVASFVEEAARSVLAQDWPAVELIAVDDGSTDGTGEILDALAAESHPPGRGLRVIRQANRGAAAARNKGLAAVQGAFVAFMDADDRWPATLVSTLLATLESDASIDLAFPLFRYVDEAGHPIGAQSRATRDRFDASDLLVANPIHSATGVIIRRDAIATAGSFDESLTSCIDLDFFVRVAMIRPGNVAATRAALADYRQRGGQITGDWRRMDRNWERVFEKALAAGLVLPRARVAEARARWALYCATLAYRAGDHRAARRQLFRVWRLAPRVALGDRHARVRTLACFTSLLPRRLHDGLRTGFNRVRIKLGRDWS